MKELKEKLFPTQNSLIRWLETNYASKDSIWAIYYKKAANRGDLNYEKIVNILLRYGWIDSLPNKIDDLKTKIRISPRSSKSMWSQKNKLTVAQLKKDGLMHHNGTRVVNDAKKSGTWDGLNDVENLIVPADLSRSLRSNRLTRKWNLQSKSYRKAYLGRLLFIKGRETRDKKIGEIIDDLKAKK